MGMSTTRKSMEFEKEFKQMVNELDKRAQTTVSKEEMK